MGLKHAPSHQNRRRHGYEPEEIEEIIVERKSAEAQARNAKDLGKHGGDHMPGDRKQVDDVNLLSQGGNQVSYLTARIKRDHPEILERMKAGESTVNVSAA